MNFFTIILLLIQLLTGLYHPVLSNWESTEELQSFLDSYNAPLILVAGDDGRVVLDSKCLVIAEQMVKQAEKKNKRLSIDVLTPDEYVKYYRSPAPNGDSHAVVSAIIGHEIYYIEPMDNHFWLMGTFGQ